MNQQEDYQHFQEASMYDTLASFYKYQNPQMSIYYYQKHLQSIQKAMKERTSFVITDTQQERYYGKIRFLHIAHQIDNIDVYINGVRIYKNISPKNMSDYLTLPTGNYQVEVYKAGDMATAYSHQKVEVNSNHFHTIVFAGTAPNQKIHAFIDNAYVPKSETKLRFVHLAEHLPNITVGVVQGDEVFPALSYQKTSDYLALYPMKLALEVRLQNEEKTVIPLPPLSLEENHVYTAYIIPSEDNNHPLELLLFSV